MAMFSGFGAIHTPYLYLGYFVRPVSRESLRRHEADLGRTIEMVSRDKKRIVLAGRGASGLQASKFNSNGGGNGDWGIIRMLRGDSVNRTPISNQLQSMRDSLAANENLMTQLFLEVHEMRSEAKRLERLGTFRGKLLHIAGHFLSAFCVYKVVMATANIIFDRVAKRDPVTRYLFSSTLPTSILP